MAGMKVATAFLPYTPSASSSAADHPVTNLLLYTRPLRTWRSTAASGSITLSGSGSVAALFLNQANFATVDVSGVGTGIAVPRDRRVGRRKVWIDTPGASLPLTLTPHSPDGGAAYFELGVAAVFGTVVTLLDYPVFPRWTAHRARTVTPFISGGDEVNVDGQLRKLEWTFGNPDFISDEALGFFQQFLDLLDAASGAPVVIFENLNHPEYAYLFQGLADVPVTPQFVTFGADLTLMEAI